MKEIIFPKSLKKGDQIAIISPAGSVEEKQLEKGLEMIKQKGFVPVLGKNVYTKFSNGYGYAGTEKERISDFLTRAGGIKEYAYLKGGTLIRKTEFFDKKNDLDKQMRYSRRRLLKFPDQAFC